MKGIAHFMTGLAAASFFPWSIQAAQDGNPLYFILGGACALLPDTIDFKMYRFFYGHDLVIRPHPVRPDPQLMADRLAEALASLSGKRTVSMRFATLRRGANEWQSYRVLMDAAAGRIRIRMGPVVTTGGEPVGKMEKGPPEGSAPLPYPLAKTDAAEVKVDAFAGPSLSFERKADGSLMVHFLPWHRAWTHSLFLAALLGITGGVLWSWTAAPVIFCGMTTHLVQDQLGFMGSNLWFPFTRRRQNGLGWMHSSDAWPNFATVWLCGVLIFWNLYRAIPEPLYPLPFWKLIFYGALLPLGLVTLLRFCARHARLPPPVKRTARRTQTGSSPESDMP